MKKKELSIILLGIILFSIISIIYKPLTPLEHDVIRNVQGFMSVFPDAIPIFLGDFGYHASTTIAAILSSIILIFNKHFKSSLLMILLSLLVFPVSEFLKTLFDRPRPPVELRMAHVSSTSYPSGHSFVTSCIFGFLTYLILKYIKNKPLKITLASLSILWILTIGFSRVWLGVHHPTDILGGYTSGILFAYIFILIDKKS